MSELEQQIIGIISSAGDSKGKAFEALKAIMKVQERLWKKVARLTWKRTKFRQN